MHPPQRLPEPRPTHRPRRDPRRGLALACLLVAFVLAVAACGPEADGPAEGEGASPRVLPTSGAAARRSVILLTLDTVRADRLNSYGHDRPGTSPRMDGLLARGARFEDAIAPRSLTWPSLATVLTGLYPSGHGVIENGYGFPDELATLPKLFQDAGYRTGAFLSNMCKANHQGWDAFACSGGEDGKTLRRALDWVAGLEAEAGPDEAPPYFLWVHLFAAHGPYYNGGDRATRLDPGYEGLLGPKKWRLDRVMLEEVELTPRDIQHLDALYDAAVMGTDDLVGRLLDGLGVDGLGVEEGGGEAAKGAEVGTGGDGTGEEADASSSPVVILLADHGEELYDHNGYLYHACSPYQTALHVPLGLVAPGVIPPGLEIPQTVELIDVAPTLLDLVGIEAPAGLHGVSLVPLLRRHAAGSPPRGEGSHGKAAFSEYSALPIHTVQVEGWKLIHNPERVEPFCIAGAEPGHYPLGEAELYHLDEDPGEQTDLAAEHPDRVAALAALIEQRFRGLAGKAPAQEIDPRLREELEALGYVAN